MKRAVLFALTTLAVALLGGVILSRLFSEPKSASAVWISAALAVVVQIATFGVARRYARKGEVIKGWGLGALMRVSALMLYGLLFLGPWALGFPLEPALLSFALFIFVSTILEPLFLSR